MDAGLAVDAGDGASTSEGIGAGGGIAAARRDGGSFGEDMFATSDNYGRVPRVGARAVAYASQRGSPRRPDCTASRCRPQAHSRAMGPADACVHLSSLGGQLWGRIGVARPYVRASLLHPHEGSLSVVAKDYLRAAFGVGDGIRHRAGGEVAVGVDVPLVVECR